MKSRIVVALGVVGLTFVGGCPSDGVNEVGEVCKSSSECADGLECVQFDGGRPACLPAPTKRTPKPGECALDAHCNLGGTNLWPVEARCDRDRGVCVCDAEARDCGKGRTFSPDCLCVDDDN